MTVSTHIPALARVVAFTLVIIMSAPSGSGAVDPQIALLTDLVSRLTDLEDSRMPRPKAIQCRVFKIGDNWPDFSAHFVASVTAAHGLTTVDTDAVNAACLSWIASKLEPGPTLSTYKNLTAEEKGTWPSLNAALEIQFADENEREIFLADVASFKRKNRNLLEYKTELMRLMGTHLSELKGVATEFQREAVTRFIEGLDDDKLKRKLRRHCKRENNTLEAAYEFAIKYETSNIQTRIREGEAALPKPIPNPKSLAAFEKSKFALSSGAATGAARTFNSSSEYWKLQHELNGMVTRQKIMDSNVQELMTEGANITNRVDCITKEVGRLSEQMAQLENTVESRFDRFEQILAGNAHHETASESDLYDSAAAAVIEHPYAYPAFRGHRAPAYHGRSFYEQ